MVGVYREAYRWRYRKAMVGVTALPQGHGRRYRKTMVGVTQGYGRGGGTATMVGVPTRP